MKKYFKYTLVVCVMLAPAISFSSQSETDSLKNLLRLAKHDTTRLHLNVYLSEICDEQDILSFAKPAVEIADQLLLQKNILENKPLKSKILHDKSLALNNIGVVYRQQGDLLKALYYYEQALKIREQTGDQKSMAESYNNIGDMHIQQGNIPVGLEYLMQSLKIREAIKDSIGISTVYNNLGLIYLQQGNPEKGIEYFQKCLAIEELYPDNPRTGFLINNMARIYDGKKDSVNALKYYLKSYSVFEKLNHKRGLATVLNNLGATYYNYHRNPDKGLNYYNQGLSLWKEIGDKPNTSLTLNSISGIYFDLKKYLLAREYGENALRLAREVGIPENIRKAAQQLYMVYKSQKKFREALEMHTLFIQMRDSIFNEETQNTSYKLQLKYEYDKEEAIKKTERQKELAIAEEERKQRQIITYAIAGGLFLVLLFSAVVFNRLRITRRQKKVIEAQKKTVDQKNKHITDSINYAKRIQDSILPTQEELSKCFSDYFIFFKPKEIVSGDFYWLSSAQNGKKILAVADCTGHGVPGAFMSMIGNTLLNEIVNEKNILHPCEILNQLNEGIIQALHQESRAQDDGMDISVCLFEEEKITFAGANHSMYIVQNDSLNVIKGDIYSIGSMFGKKDFSFSQQEIPLRENSFVYFSTDGFSDQVGGTSGKKFFAKQLENLLLSIASLEIKEQEKELKKIFDTWKGNYTQLDDVLLAGIKI